MMSLPYVQGDSHDHSATFEFRKMRFAFYPDDNEFRRLKYTTKLPLGTWAKRTGYGSAVKVCVCGCSWGLSSYAS